MLDDDWPPPPPERDFEYENFIQGLLHAVYELRSAAAGELEFGLSCGISAIQHAAGEGLRVHDQDNLRRDLLTALARAHAAARVELPDLDRDELTNGINAAIGIVTFMFEIEVRRAATVGELDMLHLYARILRNELHNRSLSLSRIGARRSYREGLITVERFGALVRRDAYRMAENEVMNEELRTRVRGKPAPRQGLRLIA